MSTPLLSVNTSTGLTGVTLFKFDSGITDSSYKIVWYFGDGSSHKGTTAQHVYHSPGKYSVMMMAYPKTGAPFIVYKNIDVSLHLNYSIKFSFVPPPTFAGHYNRYPFRVEITSPDTLEHYINLGCQFSRSDSPQDVANKWTFLRPQWRFFDLKGNQIQRIKTNDTVIKLNDHGIVDPKGTHVAGVSGYANFYFTDDIYNSDLAVNGMPYSTIIATLDTLESKDFTLQSDALNQLPSFANSLASVTCPHIFLWRTPDVLKVSENGIRPYVNPRWTTSQIPVVVSVGISDTFYDPFLDGNGVKIINPDSFFVHNFPLSNEEELYLNLQISGYDVPFTPKPILSWTDSSNYKTPGYYKGSFDFPETDAKGVKVEASLMFGIPVLSGNYYNPMMWISSPEANQLYITQLQKFKELKTISIKDPLYNKNITLTNSLSSNRYITAVGHLPDYHSWVMDCNLKKIYRISTYGQILHTIDIPQVVANTCYLLLSGDKIEPSCMVLDGEKNIWFSLKNSLSTFKLDPWGNCLFATHPFISGGAFTTEKPLYMEADQYNNVYVSYSHHTSGFVIKYAPDGSIFQASHDIYLDNKKPKQIVNSTNGESWYCTLSGATDYYIEKKSFDNNLLYYTSNSAVSATSFGPFLNVNHLTLDKGHNLWFTYNNRSLAKITNGSYEINTLELTSDFSPSVIASLDAIKGLAADFSGNIYVINSHESQMYVVDSNSVKVIDTYFIKNSSAAMGDWNGFNWINKYGHLAPEFSMEENYRTVTGSSNYLNFFKDNTTEYGIFKVNENYF
jgi:hypothetical protein